MARNIQIALALWLPISFLVAVTVGKCIAGPRNTPRFNPLPDTQTPDAWADVRSTRYTGCSVLNVDFSDLEHPVATILPTKTVQSSRDKGGWFPEAVDMVTLAFTGVGVSQTTGMLQIAELSGKPVDIQVDWYVAHDGGFRREVYVSAEGVELASAAELHPAAYC